MTNTASHDRYQALLTLVEVIVAESGDPVGFDAGRWLDDWLGHTVPALGTKLPMHFLESDEGCGRLAQLLRQMQSGAYA